MRRHALVPVLCLALAPALPARAAPWPDAAGRTTVVPPAVITSARVAEFLSTARDVAPTVEITPPRSPVSVQTAAPAATDGTWRAHPCSDCFVTLAVAADGAVWGGSYAGGLTRWEPRDGTWRRYTTADGLAGDGVWYLAADPRGGLWASLHEGHYPAWWPVALAHFDGSRWTHFTTADGLPSLNVVDLDVDPAGGVWVVAGGAGVARYDGTAWTLVTTADGLASNAVDQMAVAPDGTAWFATDAGLSRRRGGRWDTFAPAGDSVTAMVVDRAGVVWMALQDASLQGAGIRSFDGTSWRAYTMADGLWSDTVYQLAVDAAGAVWALSGTRPSALSRFDGARWVTTALPPARGESFARALAAGTDGSLYLTFPFQGGLARLRGGSWTDHRAADGPDAHIFFSVAVDPLDRAWFLPFENSPVYSLLRHEPGGWRTVRGPSRQPPGLFLSRGIAADAAGGIWHGDGANQVARFDGTLWRTWGVADGLPADRARDVAVGAAGQVWVATDAGAARWDGAAWRRFTTADGLPTDSVHAIAVDRAGDVYFGTDGAGVARWDGALWTTYTTGEGLGSDVVRALALDGAGQVWAAGVATISRLDGTRWLSYASPLGAGPLDPGALVGLAADSRGRIWHAVGDAGAARFDGATWELFDHSNGLLSDVAFDVAVDRQDHVWVATIMGVSELVPDIAPPTVTPSAPTAVPPSPTPGPGEPCVCALVRRDVPPAVVNDAVANPARYAGWRQPLDPGKPVGPLNPLRTCLSLRNPGTPYHALFNGPIWRVGCP